MAVKKKSTRNTVRVLIADLQPVLDLAVAFTADRDIVPALQCLFFDGTRVSAFTGQAGAVCTVPFQAPAPFAVEGRRLAAIVRSLAAQGVETVELDLVPTRLHVRASGYKGSLPLLPMDSPEVGVRTFIQRTPPKSPTLVPPDLALGLRRVAFAVSQEETRPQLRGIYVAPDVVLAADGPRVAATKLPQAAEPWDPIVVPDYLLKLLGARMASVTKWAREGGMLWFFLGADTAVYGTLLEVEFPVTLAQNLIATARKAVGVTLTLPDRAGLDLLLDRVLLSTAAPLYRVLIRADGKTARLEVPEGEGGLEAEQVLPVTVDGEGVCALNAKALRASLVDADTGRCVIPPAGPVYFLSRDQKLEHVVAPLAL
jgi:hypothetical protein